MVPIWSTVYVQYAYQGCFQWHGTNLNAICGQIARRGHTFLRMAQVPRTVIAPAVHLENFLPLPMHLVVHSGIRVYQVKW